MKTPTKGGNVFGGGGQAKGTRVAKQLGPTCAVKIALYRGL